MIFKLSDNGLGNGITYVEVSTEPIDLYDWYLYIDKEGDHSIELCDSSDLASQLSNHSKYKKIFVSIYPFLYTYSHKNPTVGS